MAWAAKSLLFRCGLGFSGRNRLGRGVTVYFELRYGIAICAYTPTGVTVYSLYGRLPAPEPQGDGATGGVAGGFQIEKEPDRAGEGAGGRFRDCFLLLRSQESPSPARSVDDL